MSRVASVTLLTAIALLGACSSNASSPTPASSSDGGADGGDGDGGDDVPAGPGAAFKTYVILGDSISDRGGQGPFFYDLVGADLKAKLGDVAIVKGSKEGAVSADLAGQVSRLPATLASPVAVSVTIGGNDMQDAALQILQGEDEQARTAFGKNLAKAYDELTRPGRFGDGVKVTVFHANIYDPTDGEGNFAEAGCPGYLSAFPKTPTTAFWDAWNKVGADTVAKYGDAIVTVDVRAKFQGHGIGHFADGTSWFYEDCIHPNTAGHEALHQLFSSTIEP